MRTKLFLLVVIGAQLSCGGMEAPPLEDVESLPPDMLQTPSWPDAADLGVVVSSEILPSVDTPPPPDFAR